MTHVFEDIACTACGCVCDDLRISVSPENRIVAIDPPCPLAQTWFRKFGPAGPQPGEFPIAEIDGQGVELPLAITQAAKLLTAANAPLIYGLSLSSTPGQRAAVELADRLGATIDTTASQCHAPSIMAVQQIGESTCSLGEAKYRADLVIYWGVDPLETHPRHIDRYSPPVLSGFPDTPRTIVVVDTGENRTAASADHFLKLPEDRHFETLWILRSLLRQQSPTVPSALAHLTPQIQQLAELMRNARCGIVYFGLGLTAGPLGEKNVEALLLLTRELNDTTRFHARRMRIFGDVAGADSVLCWQTGFPFSVNLARGFPRYNPGEFSANNLLVRREVDVCVIVGDECRGTLSPAAQQVLTEIPTIVLQSAESATSHPAQVRFRTATYGIHAPGTAYRMDEVPIPLRSILPTNYPTDAEILSQVTRQIPPR